MTLPASVRVNAAFPFPALVQGSGPITVTRLNGIWTLGFDSSIVPGGNTFTSLIVNEPNNVTPGSAFTVNKGSASSSALDIKNAVDNSGRTLRLFGPNDIATNTPAQYFDTGGFRTKLFILISGFSTGTGDAYNISFPTADACMLSVWADVAKGIQVRGGAGIDAPSGGGAALDVVSGNGFYTGAIYFDGTFAWGATNNATFAGRDTFLGRGNAAALLQIGGPDSGAPVSHRLAGQSVASPISSNTGFLYGKTFHLNNVTAINPGDILTDSTNPAFIVTTTVLSVDVGNSRITVDNYGNPYQGDTFLFNGVNAKTLTNQFGSTRIGYGSIPTGVVVGQTVTDTDNPTAIPGATTISSIDTSAPPGSGGAIFIVLSNVIDGVLFNTGPGAHDTVVFSTPNTAAVDTLIAGGRGTGTGAGGKLRFQGAAAGGAGSTQNTWADFFTLDPANGITSFQKPPTTPSYTVGGTLPAAAANLTGARAHVTNSNATLTAGIGAIVAAGGANIVPVFCDGTNWRIG
jgi:hypothetical protein